MRRTQTAGCPGLCRACIGGAVVLSGPHTWSDAGLQGPPQEGRLGAAVRWGAWQALQPSNRSAQALCANLDCQVAVL